MPIRISGVILPDQKRVEIALTRVYGIGRSLSGKILSRAGVDPSVKVKDLTDKEAGAIRELIERETPVEGELRRDISDNIRRLKDINCYRGTRHMRHLPVHGQRTKTNSRTVRGNVRRTAGSGRRPAAEKT